MAERLVLGDGQVLRGVFRQNDHGPQSGYPDGIEEFPSVEAAEDALNERARSRAGDVYYVGQPVQRSEWPDGDRTCYLDVWIHEPREDEDPDDPDGPEIYDQRWHPHGRGVRRENY
ncbi:hypothetical protein AB0M39_41885 [Streptomyces sp. NPDC051907]|uniref:hypothetical protein n=1 Tax=Streptomyces sp. NPDC051907 TaxID=3155284 RepID=UPI00342898C8